MVFSSRAGRHRQQIRNFFSATRPRSITERNADARREPRRA